MELESFLLNRGQPRLVFATGAGLSKESGINTFRDADDEGLWDQYNVDEICNIATFHINYQKVHHFYNMLRVNLANVEPNIGHHIIAEYQQLYGHDRVLHITANVDDLAERAGGTAMHVHGKLTEVVEPYSTNSEDYEVLTVGYENFTPTPGIISKPNIVMFGEGYWFTDGVRKPIYDDLYRVLDNLTSQDTVIIIGSSDTVIPWSVYVGLATPAETLNVNPEAHEKDDYFTYNMYQPISNSVTMIDQYVHSRMDRSDYSNEEY
ncbi:hypothetical protein pEaSNUABM44_00111 [Erwinia phage pEa_SNUABM_44]|nr:hypothetical protein pEaSNUABM44_00111 [Erwinia phage pEa_SNUABM_44]